MSVGSTTLLGRIIFACFAAAVTVTPLIYTTSTTELFEVPKMLIVYGLSAIILTATALKVIVERKIILPKGPIVYAFLAFLMVQIVATFFSIDKFTSIYGYPTRLNGGLLSQIAYFAIFVCALINLDKPKSQKLIAISVITALAVSLWGIPSHFGYDPNCFVITNRLTADCWQAEFQPTLRIFSTLGQPNWLASYLVLTLPLSAALFITGKTYRQKAVYGISSIAIFLALIFTNSRSGAAGSAIAIFIFAILLGKNYLLKNKKVFTFSAAITVIFLLAFGSTLFQRLLETRTGVAAGGTETGRIRTVVWQGAWQIFLKNPILGTGPETFPYSYQKIRPLAHNQLTEWNFFYNKAHNELLNYLANIGIVGFGAYAAFLFFVFKVIARSAATKQSQNQIAAGSLGPRNDVSVLAKAAIAAIAGYQVTIFFGFSVVATQALMYLIIAQVIVIGKPEFREIPLKLNRLQAAGFILLTLFSGLYPLISTFRLYFADVLLNRAKSTASPSRSTQAFTNALMVFPTQNPFITSDFANYSAIYGADSEDPSIFQEYASLSDSLAKRSFQTAPNNFLTIRRLVGAYILTAPTIKEYHQEGEKLSQKLIELAPTDPQTYLTVAKFYAAVGNQTETVKNLETALGLKPGYTEAQELFEQIK